MCMINLILAISSKKITWDQSNHILVQAYCYGYQWAWDHYMLYLSQLIWQQIKQQIPVSVW